MNDIEQPKLGASALAHDVEADRTTSCPSQYLGFGSRLYRNAFNHDTGSRQSCQQRPEQLWQAKSGLKGFAQWRDGVEKSRASYN